MSAIAQWQLTTRPAALSVGSPNLPDRSERHRRLIVRLVGVAYWLLIFEGMLRSWIRRALAATRSHSWQITGDETSNGYAWLFIAFCMAAALHARTKGVSTR